MRAFSLAFFILIPSVSLFAQDAVLEELSVQITGFEESAVKSRGKVIAWFDTQIAKAQSDGDLAQLKQLQNELDSFERSGTLLRANLSRTYEREMRSARRRLEDAYEEAVKTYTRAGKISDAESIQSELLMLRQDSFNRQILPFGRWVSLMPNQKRLDGWLVTRSGSKSKEQYAEKSLTVQDCSLIVPRTRGVTNVAVKATVKAVSEHRPNFGLKLRCTAGDDGYTFYFSGSKVGIGKKVGGAWQVLKEATSPSRLSEPTKLAVVLHGEDLIVYVNGIKTLTASDQELKSGCVGVMAYNSTAVFHDVQVQRLPSDLPKDWQPRTLEPAN